MKNPWTKKNPFMSMWLSGANAIAGSARGRATAAVKRQTTSAMNEGARQMVDAFSGGLLGKPAPKKRKRR